MLPVPVLDDRRFQDLVDEAKRMVMRRCPEWTDHNVSDPGVTLIETFAYMTDVLLYRVNRVPDRLYLKFLELIGLHVLPATAATAPVTFWLAGPPETDFVIPRGTEVGTAGTSTAEPVVFSTVEDLRLMPTTLVGLVTQAADGSAEDRTAHTEFGNPVAVFSTPPAPGDLLHLGLDVAAPSCAVRLDLVALAEGVGVNPKRPPLVWEAFCDGGWVECDVTADETGGLNRSGSLIVHVPPGHSVSVEAGRACGWLRARVTEPEAGQPAYAESPVVREVTACTIGGTVAAVNARIVESATLSPSEGVAGQRFLLAEGSVVAGVSDPVVEVSSEDGWQQWTRVENFAESGPDDRHYVLDPYAGEVAMGPVVRLADGTLRQYGAVPGEGAVVRVRELAVGGGPAGNVPARKIVTLRTSVPFVTSVENRYPATGGTTGESIAQARDRGPLLLRTRDRAVTAEDYEVLAKEAAPEVARVRCVPADGVEVPAGSVKVLVVPAAPSEQGRVALEDLIPSAGTLDRVRLRLEEAKVAGVNVLIEPPRYRGITVVARLRARKRVDPDQVRTSALEALYRLLSPLPGGGPDNEGWPFGRPLQQGELFATLRDVRGVDLVEDLRLFGADPVTGKRGAETLRLELDRHSLVFSFEHQVRVEEA